MVIVCGNSRASCCGDRGHTGRDGCACTFALVAGHQDWLTASCIAVKFKVMSAPLKQNKTAHHSNLVATIVMETWCQTNSTVGPQSSQLRNIRTHSPLNHQHCNRYRIVGHVVRYSRRHPIVNPSWRDAKPPQPPRIMTHTTRHHQ